MSRSFRRWCVWLVLAPLPLGSCGDGSEPADCSLAGHWRAEETRVGGSCATLQAVRESHVVLSVVPSPRSSEASSPWRFRLKRREARLRCYGEADEGRCRIELTCDGGSAERVTDISMELDLTRAGALSGRESLRIMGGGERKDCVAEYRLEGERVSPLELPGEPAADR